MNYQITEDWTFLDEDRVLESMSVVQSIMITLLDDIVEDIYGEEQEVMDLWRIAKGLSAAQEVYFGREPMQ